MISKIIIPTIFSPILLEHKKLKHNLVFKKPKATGLQTRFDLVLMILMKASGLSYQHTRL